MPPAIGNNSNSATAGEDPQKLKRDTRGYSLSAIFKELIGSGSSRPYLIAVLRIFSESVIR
jgi:hypothetical protein